MEKWTTRTGRSLSILRADARTPGGRVGAKLHSPWHGAKPPRKLEDSGVITGYTVPAPRVRAAAHPRLDEHRREGNAAPKSYALRGEPAVGTLHTTNGHWDIVAEVRAESPEAFDAGARPHPHDTGIATQPASCCPPHKA